MKRRGVGVARLSCGVGHHNAEGRSKIYSSVLRLLRENRVVFKADGATGIIEVDVATVPERMAVTLPAPRADEAESASSSEDSDE